MADDQVSALRSRIMKSVPRADTKPELVVRRLCHSMGHRFRLHRRDLPGSPDLVFPRLSKIIFVHGCFWHRHPGCSKATMPKSRQQFWTQKFDNNVLRDARSEEQLWQMGWTVAIVWECETRNKAALQTRLANFLEENVS
ncbi:MAG: very short patch repair endonuclease [Pseudomonadota bacterium]